MSAPLGAIVKISPYDWSGPDPAPGPGAFLLTQGGSAYQILDATETQRPGRFRLTCLKVDIRSVPPGARMVELVWYRRSRIIMSRPGAA